MNKLITVTLISVFLCACGGKTGNTTAQTIIATAEATAPAAAGLATTAYLSSITDKAKQQQAAAYFYAGANGLYSLSTGQNLTPDQMQQALLTFMGGADNPVALEIANLVVGFYSSIYPQFGIAGKSPAVFISRVAQGVSNNAKPFLAPQ